MSTTTATETGKIQPRLKQKYNAEIKKAAQMIIDDHKKSSAELNCL